MSSLAIALTHAIAFLTRPLVGKYSPTTIDRLHAALESQLVVLYKPTWVDSDPSHGSSQRVLSLGPTRLPPRAIWTSGNACGIQWSDWIAALGGFEFDLFVDPGCVAFRIGAWAESFSGIHIIWQEKPTTFGTGPLKQKTLAQSIVDDEENMIFSMIDDEISAPTWMSPILDQFPVPSTMNLPTLISRPSSRSSTSAASSFSFSSSDAGDSASSYSTPSSCRSSLDLPPVTVASVAVKTNSNDTARNHRSRRSRPRVPEVFIDASKTDVTNYDGGKTTVLTGGVMLGAPPSSSAKSDSSNGNWRRRSTGRW